MRLLPRPILGFIAAATAIGVLVPATTDQGALAATMGSLVTYFNQKFGFSLSVPADIFVPAPARNQEQGGLWTSRDGQARLIAVATVNETKETLATYRRFVIEETYQGASIEYAPVRETWFVLSGSKDGRAFYQRINFICGGRYIYGWQLDYPVAEKRMYDRVIEHVHRTYRPGRGEDGRCGRPS
jgi:hypothetical protein